MYVCIGKHQEHIGLDAICSPGILGVYVLMDKMGSIVISISFLRGTGEVIMESTLYIC